VQGSILTSAIIDLKIDLKNDFNDAGTGIDN